MRYCPLCNRQTVVLRTDVVDSPFVTYECDACGFVHRIEDTTTRHEKIVEPGRAPGPYSQRAH